MLHDGCAGVKNNKEQRRTTQNNKENLQYNNGKRYLKCIRRQGKKGGGFVWQHKKLVRREAQHLEAVSADKRKGRVRQAEVA